MKTVYLRPDGARRALKGHLWIFSNEIEGSEGEVLPGEDVRVLDARGRLVGSGTANPNSLIGVRLHAPGRETPLDADFIRAGIARAAGLRRKILGDDAASACRMVYSEGDSLPGLIVDRFGDHLSVQLLTAAMEARTQWVLDALEEAFSPKGILLRNDARPRLEEGLELYVREGRGEVPPRVEFAMHGLKILADLHTGQKTGFFFDQRENYALMAGAAEGARVLDTFCYSGSWGLHAMKLGAGHVTFCDASEGALELARANAEANGFGARAECARADAVEYLKTQGESWDLVILDPPAFVKSRKKVPEALKGYLNLNKWGMRAVKPGGFLVTCSCSHHVYPEVFADTVALAAREAGRRVRVLGSGRQAPDHPWIPAMPETSYLKVLFLSVD